MVTYVPSEAASRVKNRVFSPKSATETAKKTGHRYYSDSLLGVIIGGSLGVGLWYVITNRRRVSDDWQMERAEADELAEKTQSGVSNDIAERLIVLAELKDREILSEEEYQAKKKELLNRL